jgi:hypothetical protein
LQSVLSDWNYTGRFTNLIKDFIPTVFLDSIFGYKFTPLNGEGVLTGNFSNRLSIWCLYFDDGKTTGKKN